MIETTAHTAARPLATDVVASVQHVVDHLVHQVPGVTGAVASTADGFVLASRLPPATGSDAAAVAAMSAATLGLANRLVQLTGAQPANVSIQRSAEGQVLVFRVAHVAALTILATPTADIYQLQMVGRELSQALHRIFRAWPHP